MYMERAKGQIIRILDGMKELTKKDPEAIWDYAEPELVEFKSFKLIIAHAVA